MIARAIGGIAVDRGSGSSQSVRDAEAALKAGEVVIVLPQGTIPRGYDFFDPVLHGKTGTARLAASTGATVVPGRPVGDREGVAPLGAGARLQPGPPPTHGDRARRQARGAVAHRRQGGHRDHHGGHHGAAACRGAGAPRADRRRSWLAPSRLGEGTARQRDDAGRQRRLAPTRTRAGHRGRRAGRAAARPPAPRAPERGAPGCPRHRDQREDHDDAAADGRARRGGGRRREQRDRVEHAAGPRRRPGRDGRAARRPRGGRGLPPACPRRDRGRRRRPAEPLTRPARPHQRGAHGGGALAGGVGRGAAHPRRRQRRRPVGDLGCRRRPPPALGRSRSALAARRRGLPCLRGSHRLR